MEQDHEVAPSPQTPTIDSPLNDAAEDRVPQMAQLPQIPPLWPALEVRSNVVPAIKPKPPMTRANWVNAFWADISGQLRRLSVVSSDLFDGLLLRRETAAGSFILRELVSLLCFAPFFLSIRSEVLMLSVQRKKYEQLGDNRTFATVRVLAPDNLMRGMWQLLWTTKRERELRQFHSQMAIDPLNNRSYLEPNDQSKSTLVAPC